VSFLADQVSQGTGRFSRAATPFVVFMAVFGLWWAVTILGTFPELILPGPMSVIQQFWIMLTTENFLVDIAISILRQVGGFLTACLIAFPLGFAMGLQPRVSKVFSPIIGFSRFLPAASLVPLLIVWLGIGNTEKVVLLVIGIFPYLVSAVADEVKRVPREFQETAITLGASPKKIIWRVVLPSAAPGLVDAMRVMMGIGWTYLVVAEMVGASDGIGARIIEAQRFLNTPAVLAGILSIGVLGLLQDLAFRGVSYLLFPWRRALNS